ncbi:helix-turn-helix domain-containing protein [Sulfitobacter sp. 1A12126]|uniref:helix-turn-helix domain-containing protein n=1 Tax=Sulfitobacter sp. 1A12126 TaxID=3368591 RepID=UPI0037465417
MLRHDPGNLHRPNPASPKQCNSPIYKGRLKKVDDAEIRKLASEGMSKAQIARDLGISRMTVYRALDTKNPKAEMEFNKPNGC